MDKRTVRELAGEIWAEITMRVHEGNESLKSVPIETVDEIIEIILGVLARYEGFVIENDEDLPVTPLAPHPFTLDEKKSNDMK